MLPPLHARAAKAGSAWLLACLLTASAQAAGGSQSYSLDSDFDLGTLFNVNHDAPGGDQLQLNTVIRSFPVMWIANAGEDTVSKIDTTTGREIGRYRTWFGPAGQPGHVSHLGNAFSGAAPSRTAVDAAGNVYVANRHFDGRPADVIKILATGGIDRNGNSVIDTSSDLNNSGVVGDAAGEILPLADSNGNGIVDPNEIQDERIVWVVRIGPNNGLGRSLAIGTDGHIWVGLYNTREYYKLSSVDGSVLAGPIAVPNTPYGALVDNNGTLWGATLSSSILRMNTTPPYNPVSINLSASTYGLALSPGKVYFAYGNPYSTYDIASGTFTYQNKGFSALGVAADTAGNVYVSGSTVSGTFRGATKFRADGSIVWSSAAQPGAPGGSDRGAILDADGNLWTVNLTDHKVSKYRGSDGAPLGVYPVGNSPYTYSDATGSAFLQENPAGSWTVVHDRGVPGATGCSVAWNASIPAGTTLKVEARAADSIAGLSTATFVEINSGDTLPGSVVGQYLELKVTFTKTAADLDSPVLYDLTVTCRPPNEPPVARCQDVTVPAEAGTCAASVTAAQVDGGSSDPDGDALTLSLDPAGPYPIGTTTVTLTAADPSGESSTCTAQITVLDREAPVVACPANLTVGTDPGQCSAVVAFAASATDGCGNATVVCNPPSGSVFPKGTTVVTCTATDDAGNTASCTFTVTVNDTEAPTVSCGPTTNPSGKNEPRSGNADGFFQILGSDNCDAAPALYVKDTASSFVAGPFKSGDKVKITQAPGVTPNQKPMSGAIVAHLQLKGDGLAVAVDASGNTSTGCPMLVPKK